MKIESHDVSLEKLLQGNYFVIPKFQRPYSWEADHITDFWNDIVANLGDSYFIGSMVVYETKAGKLAVVDGQQRLTTISIFLSAIRDQFADLGSNESAQGLHQFIERKNVDNEDVYVLETESSFPYLQETVFSMDPPDAPMDVGIEEKSIEKAYSIFKSSISLKIKGFVDDPTIHDKDERHENAIKWLKNLRKTILNLSIILVALDDEDDAYLIFETLNTRGKDLALSDLLKNHFVRNLKSRSSVDKAKLKWDKLLETISGSAVDLDPDNFIVHSWQSRYDMVTKGKAFKKIRGSIKKTNANAHLDAFVSDAALWRSIFEPTFGFEKDEKDIIRSLATLREFRVVQPVPGLLSLLRAYDEKKIRRKKLRYALTAIEKFHFGFTAVTSSRSSGGISGMYSSFGRKLFEAETSDQAADTINELIGKLRERVPTPTEFTAGFEQLIYTKYNTSQRSVVRYALMQIASHENQPMIGNTDDLTIEHLIPQASIGKEMPQSLVGQLGNLILVDSKTNLDLEAKPFVEKKEILAAKGYKLPQMLLGLDDLTPEAIVSNTARLSEVARNSVWKI